MKTLFEEHGGTYTQQGDYLIPDLKLPEEDYNEIGIWGRHRRRFLKERHRIQYDNLLYSGKLYSYLTEVEKQAQKMFSQLADEMARREGITEQLKADNQIEWVRRMNNIRNRATEIVNAELIYEEAKQ